MTSGPSYLFLVGKTEDGKYLAYREHEPLFCYVCDSEEEAVRAAQETFQDYERRFLQKTGRLKARPLDAVPSAHVISSQRAYTLEEVG